MPKLTNTGDFISTIKASKALGVAVRTVQLWSDAGILPAWRSAGGHRYISRSAVEHLVRHQAEAGWPSLQKKRTEAWRKTRLVTISANVTVQRASSKFVADIGATSYRVTSSAESGLIAVGEINPNFVVVDSCLPDVNMVDMLRFLRRELSQSGGNVLLAISHPSKSSKHNLADFVSNCTAVIGSSRLYHNLYKFNALL